MVDRYSNEYYFVFLIYNINYGYIVKTFVPLTIDIVKKTLKHLSQIIFGY